MTENELKKIFDYHFKSHKAILIQNTDRYCIIDWCDKNGSNVNCINYIIDKFRGNLIISGDLGDCIATWYCKLEPAQIKNAIHDNIHYFIKKIECSSDKYVYIDSETIKDIKTHLESYYDEDDFKEFFEKNSCGITSKDELWSIIEEEVAYHEGINDTHISNSLFEIIEEFDPECHEWIFDCGKNISTRVHLWVEGLYRACEQLGI